MESFEFLGGRYNRPEQIMSGPVQAFKAQNAANGRTVFIHRVSTTEAPGEQATLLKLLTTALVKSAEAKRLVLDFGEESGYWYVVTESEPQCALLREWLQLEIDAALAGSKPLAQPVAPPAVSTATTEKADPGEFTRFLQQRPSMSSPQMTTGIVQRPTPPANVAPPANAASLPPSEPSPKALPGEFTSFFNTGKPAPDLAQNSEQKPEPEQKKEPGEFTRFFTPGLPSVPVKQAGPAIPVMREQDNPYVQRPHSSARPPLPPQPAALPMPPPAKPNEPGEFTRMFSRPDTAPDHAPSGYTPPPPVRSDPMGFAHPPSNQLNDFSDNLFNDKIEVGRPLPSSQPQQSEFTKVFGAVGSEAPPIQTPAVVAAREERSILDDGHGTQQFSAVKPPPPGALPSAASNAGEPSEFTMIMRGGYGKPVEPSPAGPPGGASTGGPSPVSLNLAPMGSMMPQLGSVGGSVAGVHGSISQHGASASSAIGSAHAGVPQIPGANLKAPDLSKAASNKKLMLFFIILGALALLLVIGMMLLMKSK